jgi:histidinol-phosphate aminotransferase
VTARLRQVLDTLPSYVAGKTVSGAIKLASNESSYPMLPIVAEQLGEVLAASNRYPDNGSVALTELLAQRYGLPPSQVAVGGGSVAVCTQIITAAVDAGDEVVYAWRSFEAYPIITSLAGGRSVQVPLDADDRHDLAAMAAAVTDRTRVAIVCSPNNPTGTAVHEDELVAFLDAVPDTVLVVIDEAYREFVTDARVPDATQYLDRPNVVVLRTFSKAYGLAGLRVGYALAGDPAIAAGIKQTQVPFAVSTIGQAAAIASLAPAAEKQLMERVDDVIAQRPRVAAALVGMGYSISDSEANFVWVRLPGRNREWTEQMQAHGVVVRPYGDEGVRVTIGTADENDAFLAAARELAGRFAVEGSAAAAASGE